MRPSPPRPPLPPLLSCPDATAYPTPTPTRPLPAAETSESGFVELHISVPRREFLESTEDAFRAKINISVRALAKKTNGGTSWLSCKLRGALALPPDDSRVTDAVQPDSSLVPVPPAQIEKELRAKSESAPYDTSIKGGRPTSLTLGAAATAPAPASAASANGGRKHRPASISSASASAAASAAAAGYPPSPMAPLTPTGGMAVKPQRLAHLLQAPNTLVPVRMTVLRQAGLAAENAMRHSSLFFSPALILPSGPCDCLFFFPFSPQRSTTTRCRPSPPP